MSAKALRGHGALFVTAAAAAFMLGGSAAWATVDANGDPALYWNQVAASGVGGNAVTSTRSFAMVAVAIHEAVNATSGFPDYRFVSGVGASGGDTRAATAAAAHALLVQLNPDKANDYNANLAASLAAVPDGAAKTQGIQTGLAIAKAVSDSRFADGASAPPNYQPVGNWVPTSPTPPVTPHWADVSPWVMTSTDQFLPPPPPTVGSAAYAVAYNEVLAIGASDSMTRTAYQTEAAKLWLGAPGLAPWLAQGLAVAEGASLSTIENARLFALLTVAVADATIALFDAKYHYDFWRPVTAINADGITWSPLIGTPNHPSYVSGHAGQSAAAATILAALLGDQHNICFSGGGVEHCFGSFSEAAAQAADSRLWGGIHWRFDNEAGFLIGQQAAQHALGSRAFDAVPEPSTWAMMIAGFGMAGALLRRRRNRPQPVVWSAAGATLRRRRTSVA